MRIIVCTSLEDGLAPIEAVARIAAVNGAIVELLHVTDSREEHDMERALHAGLVRPRVENARARAAQSEYEALEDIRRRAETRLLSFGTAQVGVCIRQGRPEREIVAYLKECNADLCVISRKSDWVEAKESGPKSVGHVARFVLDHASCAVLLLR